MAWIDRNPIQARVTLYNDDRAATPTTDYHAADARARQILTGATLVTRGYGLRCAMRTYVSQAY